MADDLARAQRPFNPGGRESMEHLPDKAISIRQPWAWAIINAGKDIENRSWATNFRGPVCIHASAYKPTQDDVDDFNEIFSLALPDPKDRARICPRHTEALSMNRGGIIGVAEIVDCIPCTIFHQNPWAVGRYGFVLRNMRRVDFIAVKGALGFFDWKRILATVQ